MLCPCRKPATVMTWETHLHLCRVHGAAWLRSEEKVEAGEAILRRSRLVTELETMEKKVEKPDWDLLGATKRSALRDQITQADDDLSTMVASFIKRIARRESPLAVLRRAVLRLLGDEP